MRGNPTVVRWGDRRRISVDPFTVAAEQQFIDLDLPEPKELILYLTATDAPPVAGLAVTWKLYLGAGAAMVIEPLTVPVQDEAAPAPLILRRSVSKLRVAAVVSSTLPGTPRNITLAGFAGPLFPERHEVQP